MSHSLITKLIHVLKMVVWVNLVADKCLNEIFVRDIKCPYSEHGESSTH